MLFTPHWPQERNMDIESKFEITCICCLTSHRPENLRDMNREVMKTPETVGQLRLIETYSICCGVETEAQGGPYFICYICENRLQSAFEFREMCRASHKQHKEKLSGWPDVETVMVKNEVHSEVEDFIEYCDGVDDVDVEKGTWAQVYVAAPEAKVGDLEKTEIISPAKVKSEREEDEQAIEKPVQKLTNKLKRRQVTAEPGQSESNFKATYICYYCDIFLTTHNEYLEHRERLHRSPNSGHGFLRLDRTCNICNENVKGYMKHIDEHHKDYKPNVCSVCNMAYQSQNELRWHLANHLPTDAVHECLACNKKFKTELALRKHILTDQHSGKSTSYLCPYCGLPFAEFRQLYDHFKGHFKLIQNKPIFPCYFCKKCFLARKLYADHKCGRTSAESNRTAPIHRTCQICDRDCNSEEEYICHKYAECDCKDDELKCNICGKEFSVAAKLARHKRHHSYKPMPCVCDICGHTSQNQSQLKLHKTRHQEERPFQCQLCDCTFKVEHRLNSHMHRHKEKQYECDFCGKFFREYTSIRQHMAMHGTVTGLKQFTCELCGKGLKSTTSLKRHMQVHTGHLDAKCEICMIEFRDFSTFNHHYKKVHEGLVYECKYCLRTWLSKEKLREHLFIHRGFKPYHCPACPQQYVKKYLYVKHLRERHRITFDLKLHGYRENEDLNGFLKECERYTKRQSNGKDDGTSLRTGGIQLILATRLQQPYLPRVGESQTGEVAGAMPATYNNSAHPFPNPYHNL